MPGVGNLPGRYREQLTAHPEQLLAVAPEGGRTVALVWRVTLDRLADTPLAAEILRVIAWWAPDHIHRSYLTPLASAPEVTEAIRRLAAHSMITLRGEEISVHRLVQAVARTSSPEDPHRSPEEVTAGRETAAALLSTQVKDSAWAMQTSWFSHAETFLGHSDPDTEQSVLLLCHTQRWRRIFLEDGGIDEVEHVLAVAKRICGRRHTTTLLARYYVAEHHLELGNWLVARDLLIRNLFVTAWMFERNHPERIMASARLARPAFESGKFWAAVEMTDRANRRAERSLGPDHETTVKLGFWAAQNKLMLALRFPNLYTERAIDEVEQQIGRHDLAGDAAAGLIFSLVEFHVRTGDPARAIRTVEMFAPKLARSHGELHVSTLSLRCLQVELLIASGRDDSAKTLLAPSATIGSSCSRTPGFPPRCVRDWTKFSVPSAREVLLVLLAAHRPIQRWSSIFGFCCANAVSETSGALNVRQGHQSQRAAEFAPGEQLMGAARRKPGTAFVVIYAARAVDRPTLRETS